MNVHWDTNDILRIKCLKYIEKMIGICNTFFAGLPNQNVTSPLEKWDHPELGTSELLDEKGIKIYQSMIRVL
jgi:hypothetical protein